MPNEDEKSPDSKRLFAFVIGLALVGIGSAIVLAVVWFKP